MSVTTKVTSSLLISETTTEADFATAIDQTRAGILEPVSTTNGTSFFYHATADNVAASGKQSDNAFVAYSETATLANEDAGKTSYDAGFNTNYGVTGTVTTDNVEYGYIDYTFYLKATSTEADQVIRMTKCNLLYNGAAITTEKAWRVAVLASAACTTASAASSAQTPVISILTLTEAGNQTSGKAAASTSSLDVVTYGTDVEIEDDIDAGVTNYYKVIIRLFLEGEDTTCNNATFAKLTEAYTLDLAIDMGNADDISAVTIIGSSVS